MTPERRLSSLFMRSMWLDVRKNRLIPIGSSSTVIASSNPSHQRPIKPPLLQPFQKIHPCSGGFFWIDVEAQDFSDTLTVCAIGNHKGLGDDPMIFPDLEVCRIHGQERIRSVQRTGPESFYVFVEVPYRGLRPWT